MILSELARLIEAGGFGTPGQTLFIYHMPDTVKRGVLIFEDIEGTIRDPFMPNYHVTTARVVVRDTDVERLLSSAHELCSYLDMKERQDLIAFQVNFIHPTALPVAYPIPESDYLEAAFSVVINYVVIPH